jgi:hypothetical protein
VKLARVIHRKLQICFPRCFYVKDNSQENSVVDSGVEDVSTASLIQLEEQTVERCIVVLDTRDISTSEKDCADCKEAAYCFV